MTVKELIKRLETFPKDAVIVRHGDDHDYYHLHDAYEIDIEQYDDGDLGEVYMKSKNVIKGVLIQ